MSVIRGRRLIGFLDILGFSHRVEEENIESLYKLFKGLIEEANTRVFSSQGVKPDGSLKENNNFFYAEFISDSIVLVSNELKEPGDTVKFIFACIHLMEIAFSMKFPLRGTIGVGEILFDLENKILLSKEFPKLVKGEAVQDWSGCFLYNDETEELVLKAIYGESWSNPGIKRSSPLISYNVPVKSKSNLFTTAKSCLNWVHLLGKNDFESGIDFLQGNKRDETLKFVRVVQSLADDSSPLSKDHAPAVVMRTMISIAQMRTCFQDESGNPVDPGADVEITLQQPGDTNQYKMTLFKRQPGENVRYKSWVEKFTSS